MAIQIKNIKKVYFIGIGGIGMSALARFFKSQGALVEGYDRTETELTQQLEQEGMTIYYDIDTDHLSADTDLFIYTPAIKAEENEELAYLIEQEAPLYKRAEILGEISKQFKTIAVAGAHGKSSTATIITYVLNECGVGASAFLGGISKNFQSNYVQGDSQWLVVEADEYDHSFLQLNPYISVITSIDADHLDVYGSHQALKDAYLQFAKQTDPQGAIIYCDAAEGLGALLNDIKGISKISYGVEDAADFTADNLSYKQGKYTFDAFKHGDDYMEGVKLGLPGWHNVQNTMAAIAIADVLGLEVEAVKESVANYSGVKRRFDMTVLEEGVFIDDYAHHPEEIRATLDAVRKMYPNRKIMAVFQPHLFSRTRDFAKGFAEALSLAHKTVLLPIYPAREEAIKGVSSELILNALTCPSKQLIEYDNAVNYVYLKSKSYPVVVVMGAGDIDRVAVEVLKKILQQPA